MSDQFLNYLVERGYLLKSSYGNTIVVQKSLTVDGWQDIKIDRDREMVDITFKSRDGSLIHTMTFAKETLEMILNILNNGENSQ